jgi:hypothetical protein
MWHCLICFRTVKSSHNTCWPRLGRRNAALSSTWDWKLRHPVASRSARLLSCECGSASLSHGRQRTLGGCRPRKSVKEFCSSEPRRHVTAPQPHRALYMKTILPLSSYHSRYPCAHQYPCRNDKREVLSHRLAILAKMEGGLHRCCLLIRA